MSSEQGAWRISDLDRENAARLLGTAMEQGRLTPAEYSDRCAAAYAARTRDELIEVLVDLAGGPLGVTQAGIGPLVLNVAFGQVRRTGRWPVPELVQITGVGQRTTLDLTEAHLERSEVVIEVSATMSVTTVLLAAHARVDTDGLELVAGSVRHRELSVRRHNRVRERAWADGAWNQQARSQARNQQDRNQQDRNQRGREGGLERGRGGLLRRRGRDEPAPIQVVLRGRATLSTVTIWQARR